MTSGKDTLTELMREAERTQYALRSSFFYRLHSVWDTLLQLVTQHSKKRPNWQRRQRWGISDVGWARIRQQKLAPLLVFCHPSLIQTEPCLIAYYRCLALLPQKGLQRLATGTQRLEEGKGTLSKERAVRIATAINGLICLLIESDPDWNLKSAQIAAIMNLGTQANGSWRNAIGVEGANRVKELLVGYLLQIGALEKITLSDGTEITPSVPSPSIQETRALAVKSGYILTFGSEPDVSIRDPQDTLISTIEVKYGLDPAGALERYGAAMSSTSIWRAVSRPNLEGA